MWDDGLDGVFSYMADVRLWGWEKGRTRKRGCLGKGLERGWVWKGVG